MPLCFIEPQDAIRVIAESVGREARRQLLGELVRAWVDEIPEEELASHYAKAVDDLDEHDLSMLAAWHASLEVGTPIANKDFLVSAFAALGENRREALDGGPDDEGKGPCETGADEKIRMRVVFHGTIRFCSGWWSPLALGRPRGLRKGFHRSLRSS
jgi:hypothetical protein